MTPRVTKPEVRDFWSDLYQSAYAELDENLTEETLRALLTETEAMFRYRRHLSVTEMPLEALTGAKVLEIGCGAGSHSALFAARSTVVVALDLATERAAATQNKFRLLGASAQHSAALAGDAEHLPFADNSFDIVYSNGVLHHTPDTAGAIREVWRVLKPGGRAVIMLYCKSSINWWVTLWFGYGILRGGLRHGTDRLGAQTEWAGTQAQQRDNPITRAYTAAEIQTLFADFEKLSLRKSEFAIAHLPKVGKLYQRWLERRGRMHPGGLLPYGAPWPIVSPFELWLGQYAGWAWNIAAIKPPAAK
jgi:ubiquinone/menaquinone biosynthesis C-methylase UbiE